MTTTNWPVSLRTILIDEGGNDDDPNDHGGRTSRGITQREYDAYRRSNPGRPADVWKAPDEDISQIYLQQYWRPYCDDLPSGIDLCFFNMSVNSGRTMAVKLAQRALGVTVDGMMGTITLQALRDVPDLPIFVHNYSDQCRNFYRHLAQFPRYGKGWMSRTAHVEAAAQKLAGLPRDTAPHEQMAMQRIADVADVPEITTSPKASAADSVQPALSPEKGLAVGTTTSGLAGMIQQVKDSLEPYAYSMKVAQYILIGVAVIGFALTIYGLWKRNKVAQVIS